MIAVKLSSIILPIKELFNRQLAREFMEFNLEESNVKHDELP